MLTSCAPPNSEKSARTLPCVVCAHMEQKSMTSTEFVSMIKKLIATAKHNQDVVSHKLQSSWRAMTIVLLNKSYQLIYFPTISVATTACKNMNVTKHYRNWPLPTSSKCCLLVLFHQTFAKKKCCTEWYCRVCNKPAGWRWGALWNSCFF